MEEIQSILVQESPAEVSPMDVPEGFTRGENLSASKTFEGTFSEIREVLVAINFKLVANHRNEKNIKKKKDLENTIREQAEEYTRFILDNTKNDNLSLLKDFIILIYHVRDIRNGKGERDLFHFIFKDVIKYVDAGTCRQLLVILPDYGYYKDLLKIAEYGYEDVKKMVIDIFAEQLVKDTKAREKEQPVSLCAKFAPRDRKKGAYVGLAHPIAEKIGELVNVRRSRYKAYRKLIAGLARYIDVTEIKMSENKWSQIDPKRVPSICMKINKHNFLFEEKNGSIRSDSAFEQERLKCREIFLAYTEKALKGEVKLTGRALQPHEFILELWGKNIPKEQLDIVEAQWMDLRKSVKEAGKLSKFCVISDVSGSMSGTPMAVSVGLGILVSEIMEKPFNDKMMCFSEKPHWYELGKFTTLFEKVKYLSDASSNGDWGQNTDFEKAIELMLTTAAGSEQKELPEFLLVLSDMQFDAAVKNYDDWELTYERIQRKVQERGFPKVPTIIFWNLRADTKDFPAEATTKGVLMMSGFSAQLLKLLMTEDDIVSKLTDSYRLIRQIIGLPTYDKVRDALRNLYLLEEQRVKQEPSPQKKKK